MERIYLFLGEKEIFDYKRNCKICNFFAFIVTNKTNVGHIRLYGRLCQTINNKKDESYGWP